MPNPRIMSPEERAKALAEGGDLTMPMGEIETTPARAAALDQLRETLAGGAAGPRAASVEGAPSPTQRKGLKARGQGRIQAILDQLMLQRAGK